MLPHRKHMNTIINIFFSVSRSYFHEQGLILYFADDQRLRETIVLRPQYFANLLRTMISTKQVISERGMLMHRDMHVLGPPWADQTKEQQEKMLDLLHQYYVSTSVGAGTCD